MKTSRKLRRNPAFNESDAEGVLLANLGSDMLVSAALVGCSASEKILIAGLIPMLVKALREVPKGGDLAIVYRDLPVATILGAKPS